MKRKRTTFIYALVDPRTDEVRYVGKSDDPSSRFQQHCSRHTVNSHKVNWIRQLQALGISPVLQIIEECLRDGWIEREVFWIAHYRTVGHLTNLTDGGDGTSGIIRSEEQRRHMSVAQRTSPVRNDPDFRALQSAIQTQRWSDPEIRARHSAIITEAWSRIEHNHHSEESREAIAAAARAQFSDPEKWARHNAAMVALGAKPKHRAHLRDAWTNPAIREKRLAGMAKTMATPEYREHLCAGKRAYWSDPATRAKQSETMKAYYAKRRAGATP